MQQNKKIEKNFFDSFPVKYEIFNNEGYERILAEFTKLVRPKSGEKVLDLGCGSGALTKRLGRWPLWVAGIDISIKNIFDARSDISEDRFIVGDIEKIPFRDNTFDIITCGAVLHHFSSMMGVIYEGIRILKPGGRFFSYDPNYLNPFMWIYRSKKSPFRSSYGITSNEVLITKNELRKCLKGAGFTDVFVTAISGITYKFVSSRIVRRLLPLYNLFDKAIDHSFFRKRHGSFVIARGCKGGSSRSGNADT